MLTAREKDVLQLLSRGCSYADVARHLGISVHTVGTHIKNAYRKLSVRTAAAAVMRALELGILTLHPGGDRSDAGRNIGAHVHRDRLPRRLERGELALEERCRHVAVAPLPEA
jgi:DNA-binding CsgD family transcriptional regulator